MKKLINEQFKRMQLLAGLITESSDSKFDQIALDHSNTPPGATAGTALNETLQMMTPAEVGPKLEKLAQDFKLYLLPQAMEVSAFSKKAKSLNNDYSSLGQGMVGVMANTSMTGGVSLLIYAAEDVKLLDNVYEVLKKDFPTITKVGHNDSGGSYMKIENFNKTVDPASTSESTNIEKSVNEVLRKYRKNK